MYLRIYIIISCFLIIGKNVTSQTIISNNGKYGILDDDSKDIAIPTIYDEIIVHHKYYENPRTDTRVYVLKKGNKYTFAIKQFWKTTYLHMQTWEVVDSTKWFVNNSFYEEIQPLGVFFGKQKHGEVYQGDTCLTLSQDYYALSYKKNGRTGLITYLRNAKTLYNIHIPGRGYGDIDRRAVRFSIEDVKINPPKYDHIMDLSAGKLLVVIDNDKYGLIGLAKNIEIEPQFESPPVMIQLSTNYSRSNEQSYYYVKKNGLWGAIYLSEDKQKKYTIAIPFHYKDIKDIKSNLRSVNFYTQHFYDSEESKRIVYDREYTASVYNSSPDTLPMELNFIIHTGELNKRTIRNKNTNKQELNKNYKPPIEKYIKFNPLMNGKPIIQQEKHEYLITSNIQHIKYTKLPTMPLFFVLKMDRLDSVYNNDYNLYNRGEIKKDEIDTNYFRKINEPFASVNQKPKAVAIYRFINDRFVPFSEFVDKNESTTYEVVTDFLEYTTYSPDRKRNVYESNFILKSTKLENGKYKHVFFTFEGTQVYEITSKFPIDYWRFIKRDPNISSSYIPDEDFALEFYTEIQGRRKIKEKIVCYYNVKTKQFYK